MSHGNDLTPSSLSLPSLGKYSNYTVVWCADRKNSDHHVQTSRVFAPQAPCAARGYSSQPTMFYNNQHTVPAKSARRNPFHSSGSRRTGGPCVKALDRDNLSSCPTDSVGRICQRVVVASRAASNAFLTFVASSQLPASRGSAPADLRLHQRRSQSLVKEDDFHPTPRVGDAFRQHDRDVCVCRPFVFAPLHVRRSVFR